MTVLVEALPRNQCDVVRTLDEAAAIVREIGSPAIQTMFDSHNAVDEAEPHDALIEKLSPEVRDIVKEVADKLVSAIKLTGAADPLLAQSAKLPPAG